MSTVIYPHLEPDAKGCLRIAGTGFKVIMLARFHVEAGMSAEELAEQFPQLNLAQIHAGLAYYYDNTVATDAEMAARTRFAEQMRQQWEGSPVHIKLLKAKQERA